MRSRTEIHSTRLKHFGEDNGVISAQAPNTPRAADEDRTDASEDLPPNERRHADLRHRETIEAKLPLPKELVEQFARAETMRRLLSRPAVLVMPCEVKIK